MSDYEECDGAYIQTPGDGSPVTSLEAATDEPSQSYYQESDGDGIPGDSDNEMSPYPSVRMSPFSVLSDGDDIHSLLEDHIPPYSNMTVRRAFIVWAHGGRANEFKQVCNYYHRLEALEKTFTPEQRLQSRLPEFELLAGQPKTSQFQMSYFPNLFAPSNGNHTSSYSRDSLSFEDRVFTLEGFLDLRVHNGVTTKDVLRTSEIIRRYCKEHSMPLKKLLCQYQTYNKKCGLENSLNNLSIYIKKQFLKDELVLHHNIYNMPKHFSFLDLDDDDEVSKPFRKAIERPVAVKKAKVKTLIHDNKKPNVCDSLLSSLPQLTAAKLACTPSNVGSPCIPNTPRSLCTPCTPGTPCSPNPNSMLSTQQGLPFYDPKPISPYSLQSLTSYSPQSLTLFNPPSLSPYNPQSLSYNAQSLSSYSPQFRAFMAKFLQGADIQSINANLSFCGVDTP